jgi:hypothetical protein
LTKPKSTSAPQPDPLTMLFVARWNVPQAAKALGIAEDECKQLFREYCLTHPLLYSWGPGRTEEGKKKRKSKK